MKVDETRFEIGEIFFVDPSLFKKEETRFTNFRR